MSSQQDFVTVQITVRIPRTLLNNTNSHHFVIEVAPGQEHQTEASTTTHIPHTISGQEKTSTTTAEEDPSSLTAYFKISDKSISKHNASQPQVVHHLEHKPNKHSSRPSSTLSAQPSYTMSTNMKPTTTASLLKELSNNPAENAALQFSIEAKHVRFTDLQLYALRFWYDQYHILNHDVPRACLLSYRQTYQTLSFISNSSFPI
ncbi:hypothetical protein B0H65DRAFT_538903 [Neurospora tetraspora]|uniref:Uncharacterized protein n=1 Tax=Neurospora tetraspora TaxID=94610 RepID=A0AAE0JIM4_9PEZI|nr:hypothetical protein B0H65DRAFT_538903 [Neurospora tetraspora]